MLLLSGVLTAFVLVLVGGVVATLAAPQRTVVEPATVPLAQREAEWRQLLAEANARLEQAYAAQNPPAPASPSDIGVLGAARAALLVAPGARLVRPPELVNYEGTPAYEVLFDQGPVYVDAATGQVLYNGPAAVAMTVRGDDDHDGSERGDDHDEHEWDGHHDEHEDDDD
jgi:hypothetical protein